MRLEIQHQSERSVVELRDGIFTFGGSSADAVRLPGAPEGLLAVLIDGQRVVVEADEPLAFDGVLAPPQVRRLWLPDETLRVGEDVSLKRLREEGAARSDGTVAVVHELFDALEGVAPAAPRLLCLTGLDLGRVFPIVDGATEIGRGETVGLRIRDRAVSRRHARVVHERGETRIEDLGTANGIYVRGRKAKGAVRLRDGDVIEIGRALLKFLDAPRPAAPEPSPAPSPQPPLPPSVPPPEPAVAEASADGCPGDPSPGAARTSAPDWWMTAGALAIAVAGALATWRITG